MFCHKLVIVPLGINDIDLSSGQVLSHLFGTVNSGKFTCPALHILHAANSFGEDWWLPPFWLWSILCKKCFLEDLEVI
jgi:hypothetical protein